MTVLGVLLTNIALTASLRIEGKDPKSLQLSTADGVAILLLSFLSCGILPIRYWREKLKDGLSHGEHFSPYEKNLGKVLIKTTEIIRYFAQWRGLIDTTLGLWNFMDRNFGSECLCPGY